MIIVKVIEINKILIFFCMCSARNS